MHSLLMAGWWLILLGGLGLTGLSVITRAIKAEQRFGAEAHLASALSAGLYVGLASVVPDGILTAVMELMKASK